MMKRIKDSNDNRGTYKPTHKVNNTTKRRCVFQQAIAFSVLMLHKDAKIVNDFHIIFNDQYMKSLDILKSLVSKQRLSKSRKGTDTTMRCLRNKLHAFIVMKIKPRYAMVWYIPSICMLTKTIPFLHIDSQKYES